MPFSHLISQAFSADYTDKASNLSNFISPCGSFVFAATGSGSQHQQGSLPPSGPLITVWDTDTGTEKHVYKEEEEGRTGFVELMDFHPVDNVLVAFQREFVQMGGTSGRGNSGKGGVAKNMRRRGIEESVMAIYTCQ